MFSPLARKDSLMLNAPYERTLHLSGGWVTIRHVEDWDGRGLSFELPDGGGSMDADQFAFFLADLRGQRSGFYPAGNRVPPSAVLLQGNELRVQFMGETSAPILLMPSDRGVLVEAIFQVLMAVPEDLTSLRERTG